MGIDSSYQTSDFTDYVATTVDPGWIRTTVIVILVQILITCTLPLWIWGYRKGIFRGIYEFFQDSCDSCFSGLQSRYRRIQSYRKNCRESYNNSEGQNDEKVQTYQEKTDEEPEAGDAEEDAIMEYYRKMAIGGGIVANNNRNDEDEDKPKKRKKPKAPGSVLTGSVLSEGYYCPSSIGGSSTISQDIARNIFNVRAHGRGTHRAPKNAKKAVANVHDIHRQNPHHQYYTPLGYRKGPNSNAPSSVSNQSRSNGAAASGGPRSTSNAGTRSNAGTDYDEQRSVGASTINPDDRIPLFSDDRSIGQHSLLSKLEPDAITADDAVDAKLHPVGVTFAGTGGAQIPGGGVLVAGGNVTEQLPEEKELRQVKGIIPKLLYIFNWDEEMQLLMNLNIPYTIQGLSEAIFTTTDIAIIGHFLGPMETNAVIMVNLLIEFTTIFSYGFSEAIGVLCPQAEGAENPTLMGRYLQMGVGFYFVGCIPGFIMWSILTERAVIWFGFDAETAILAQKYAYPYLIVNCFDGMDTSFQTYYNVIGHEKYGTIYGIIRPAANSAAIICMALLGFDLIVVGVVQAFVAFVFLAGNFSIGVSLGWFDDCWDGLAKSISIRDQRAVHTMLVTAVPLGISWILTYGEWEVMTVFVAYMGPAEVAAWGLIGYLWYAFEVLTEGVTDAAEVRVAFRLGTGLPQAAKLCCYKSMYLGAVISTFATSILFTLAPYLPGWLTPDPTLQQMIFDVIPLLGFGQIIMSVGSVAWSVIGATGRMRLATSIEVVSSWVFAIPIAAILIYVGNLNLLGPVVALLTSYSIGSVATSFVILTSDWETLAINVFAYSAREGIDYDNYYWTDLPTHIQNAAEELGYDKTTWDKGGDTKTSDLDWEELTPSQQDAATLLGYDKEKWDGEDEDESSTSSNGSAYDDYDWSELPANVLTAAKILGYDKKKWDAGSDTKTSNLDWDELSPKQQDAARLLGYNKQKWDGDDNGDESTSSSKASAYDDYDWSELPAKAQAAARILGYDQIKWDTSGDTETSDLDWDELTSSQQEAARCLGYNKQKWDGDGDDNDSESEGEGENDSIVSSYDDYDWSELPMKVQAAARILGYDQIKWDTSGDTETSDLDWDELTPSQQKAAGLLGYNKHKWDEDDEESAASSNIGNNNVSDGKADNTGNIDLDEMSWDSLPVFAQKAATVLGMNKNMWNEDEDPEISSKSWNELTPAQQKAAGVLGYDEANWDVESDEESRDACAKKTLATLASF